MSHALRLEGDLRALNNAVRRRALPSEGSGRIYELEMNNTE